MVSDRDVFIFQHTCNLFNRMATRSTMGRDKEVKFLEMVSEVTGQEFVKTPMEICDQCIEHTEPDPKFSYLLLRHNLVPEKAYRRVNVTVPREFSSRCSNVESMLKKKHPDQVFVWLNHLATVELKLQVKQRMVTLTFSLPQYCVFEFLRRRRIRHGQI